MEVFYELFMTQAHLFTVPTGSSWVLFARFICTTVLHLSLIDEVYQSLEMMKFCLNHDYLFRQEYLAFLIATFQLTAVLMVEICNVCIIM